MPSSCGESSFARELTVMWMTADVAFRLKPTSDHLGHPALGVCGHTHIGIMWVIGDHLAASGSHNA